MQVVTAAEMRDMDRQAVERYAIPEIVLMEHAGKALADRAWQLVNGSSRRRVVIFVGKGNNGGDGCVAARHLHNRGATARVSWTWLHASVSKLSLSPNVLSEKYSFMRLQPI